jgi:flagellar hook-length control protein FliK
MPEPVRSTATLLTPSASKGPRLDGARDDADAFSAKLASAVEGAEAKHPKTAAKDPAAQPAKEPPKAPAASAEQPSGGETSASGAEDESATVDPAAADSAAIDSTDIDSSEIGAAVIDPQEAGLLATFVVTETIVLETSPDAVLPTEAITSIDVDAGANFDVVGGSAGQAETSTDAVDTLTDPPAESANDSETTLTPQQPMLATSAATVMTTATADDAAAAVLTGVETQPGKGEAPSGLLGEGDTPPTPTPAELSADDSAEASGETDKASTSRYESASPPPTDAAATTTAALAAATLPTGPASDVDELKPLEATDGIDANLTETAPSRDGARVESADKASSAERPTFDPARFVSRVSRAIETAAERGGPVEIRLSPPELGSLQVKIQVKDGAMTAMLEVETPAARNAVLDNLPALRDRLEQQQIRIDKFDVEVRDNQQQRGGDWRQHQDQRQQADPQQLGRESRQLRQPSTPTIPTVDAPAARLHPYANNGINLVV